MLALALAAPFYSVAAETPAQNPSATKTTVKNFRPPLPPTGLKKKYEIERVGNLSSRPWTEIVGWRPGTSQFPDAENHVPQLVLVSLNF